MPRAAWSRATCGVYATNCHPAKLSLEALLMQFPPGYAVMRVNVGIRSVVLRSGRLGEFVRS